MFFMIEILVLVLVRREQGSPLLDIHFKNLYIMQQIVIRGNLTRDAELVTFGERQQVKFTVACNEGKNEKKVTTYYDVLSYSTGIHPYLQKGKDVVVAGRLSVRTSQGKDGKTYTNLNVYADGVELCGRREDSPATSDPHAVYNAAPSQDTIPF